jgi:hypothetical protein
MPKCRSLRRPFTSIKPRPFLLPCQSLGASTEPIPEHQASDFPTEPRSIPRQSLGLIYTRYVLSKRLSLVHQYSTIHDIHESRITFLSKVYYKCTLYIPTNYSSLLSRVRRSSDFTVVYIETLSLYSVVPIFFVDSVRPLYLENGTNNQWKRNLGRPTDRRMVVRESKQMRKERDGHIIHFRKV